METFNTAKYDGYVDLRAIPKIDVLSIIGIGTVGSHVAVLGGRMNVKEIHLYDFDVVEEHNLANQAFRQSHIGMLKVDACEEMIKEINPTVKVVKHPAGCHFPYVLKGVVVLCADNIDVWKDVLECCVDNPDISCFLNFRMRLTDAQHYFAENTKEDVNKLLETMDFTNEEAKAATPVSACGVEQSVIYTTQTIVSMGWANMMNYLMDRPHFKRLIVYLDNMKIIKM